MDLVPRNTHDGPTLHSSPMPKILFYSLIISPFFLNFLLLFWRDFFAPPPTKSPAALIIISNSV